MEKYSFKEILEKEITIESGDGTKSNIIFGKIEIPKIQRDYAQGRVSEKEIRNRFLNAIFESLSKNELMEMDFVYGSVVGNTRFTPLDGQQRLTTLFLLYWYIGTKELETTERKKLYKSLQKFTYETRTSSRSFCKELTQITDHSSEEKIISFEKKPSEEITNLHWFYKSYKQDPTIKSMLNMLDAIHEKYIIEDKTLFENLENLQFYVLVLNGFNLTDELYVKMNARGKQLTDFENLKADITKWMKNEKNPYQADFIKDVELGGREMKYYFSISQKIDTNWTAFFWQMTKDYDTTEKDNKGNLKYPEGKVVDPLFMRLFYRYFLQKYILSSTISSNVIDRETDYKLLYEEGKFQNFQVFENLLNNKSVVISDFECFLDKLKANWEKIENAIIPSWYGDKKWSFLDSGITQPNRVIFLAICLFLEQKKEFDIQNFKQWMRIVWNIVENPRTDISNTASMIAAMKLIKKLSSNGYDIYSFLENKENIKDFNSSEIAIEEEHEKSHFIVNNPNENWEEEFISAEKHPFFKGAVSFIITDNMTITEFKHRKEVAFKVFDDKGIKEEYRDNGHIFLRALISKYAEFNQFEWGNYTDKTEYYVKHMLTSYEVVRNATREWFSLPSDILFEKLCKEVCEKSEMTVSDSNDVDFQRRVRKVHEDLYKNESLQNWMQQNDAIRVGRRGDKIYISRPSSWHDWILLDGYRNEIMDCLLKNFSCVAIACQCSIDNIPIPFFFGNEDVRLTRQIRVNDEDYEFEYVFDRQFVRVGLKETTELGNKFIDVNFTVSSENDFGETAEGWICRKIYDYQNEVTSEEQIYGFVEKIENEVFNLSNSDSLIARLTK